jgi:hypothetical protein
LLFDGTARRRPSRARLNKDPLQAKRFALRPLKKYCISRCPLLYQ